MTASRARDDIAAQQRRGFWLRQLHQWHWISAAVCLVAMLLFTITGITLVLTAKVPGIDEATFQQIANAAKAGCVISRALAVPVTLQATLEA